jgi:hypothetical protein
MMISGALLDKTNVITLVLTVFFISLFLFLIRTKPSFNFLKIGFFKQNIPLEFGWRKTNKLNLVIIAVLCLLIAFPLLYGSYWPVTDWDSLVLYDYRALSFVNTGTMEQAISQGYFFGYPLLTSLGHAWSYLFNLGSPAVLHALFYAALLGLFYVHLKNITNVKTALLFTLLLAATRPIFGHAQIAYSNLPYTVYLIGGYLYLYRFLKEKKLFNLIISSLLVGFSAWTRIVEPFWITAVLALLVILFSDKTLPFHKKLGLALMYFLLISAIRYPWLNFENSYLQNQRDTLQRAPKYLGILFQFDWRNLLAVIDYLITSIIRPQLLLYLVFAISLFGRPRKKVVSIIFPLIIFLNLGLMFAGTIILSVSFETWNKIAGSVTRLSMIFIPLLLFEVALTFHHLFSKKS